MRLPNGYGSITKLKGNRRKPYMVRLNANYTLDVPDTVEHKEDLGKLQVHENRKVLGYYRTKKEALQALDEYNKNPNSFNDITFKETYERMLSESTASVNTKKMYSVAFNKLTHLHDKHFHELSLSDFQPIVSKSTPASQMNLKSFLSCMYKYALRYDICTIDISSRLVTVPLTPKTGKKPFTDDEIRTLWEMPPSEIRDFTLCLLYSGWRISELLTCEVDYNKNVMVGGVKTIAGKCRTVPIHPRIKPLLQQNKFTKTVASYSRAMNRLIGHTPHECRHTFVTKLINAGVPEYIVQKLVGHTSNVTNDVYNHVEYDTLYDAVLHLK